MKAGDKIRPKEVPGPHLERELLFVGKTQVVYRTVEDGSEHEYAASLSAVQRQFEVVPDFFEVGKRYRLTDTGLTTKKFTVAYIDTHPDTGERYAHGWIRETYPGRFGRTTFAGSTTKFDGWEEDRD